MRRPRVLIVDDNEETREMYAWCMRAAGWIVDEAQSGDEALAIAPATQPDAIVMDLRMPVIGGIETTRFLKDDDRTKHIPVVACTALPRSQSEKPAREAGCDVFVLKPCAPDTLLVLVEGLVRR